VEETARTRASDAANRYVALRYGGGVRREDGGEEHGAPQVAKTNQQRRCVLRVVNSHVVVTSWQRHGYCHCMLLQAQSAAYNQRQRVTR